MDEIPLPVREGRLWLSGKHFVGPDPAGAQRATGATTVVCLCERDEIAGRYPDYAEWLRVAGDEQALWYPIPDLGAPPPAAARDLVADLRGRLAAGDGLLVHCGAGIGRAGTVAVALLVDMGVPLEDALAHVAAHRPMAGPEAGPQRDLLTALAATGPNP